MEFSHLIIEGQVKKKIEHVEWYHSKEYHTRFIKIDFATARMLIFKNKAEKEPQHAIKFEEINGCNIVEDVSPVR